MSTDSSENCEAVDVASNIEKIRSEIAAYSKGREGEVKLLAVSKTKPMSMLMEAYDKCGQRHFGENYVQELMEKAKEMPKDIKWHMIGTVLAKGIDPKGLKASVIGHLQRNKVTPLLKAVPHLYAVESVDSIKLADKLNAAATTTREEGLRSEPSQCETIVFIEVMTSDEITKTGIEKDEDIDELAEHITTQCTGLKLLGLMTVANPDLTIARENFERLAAIRERLAKKLSLSHKLELSMGMTHDMQIAIECGEY
ncbi:hypothetical protein FOZ60_007200 [Perkinsus olseni]|uniref:Pyridoxal phosphate homeostasis protein n=1 Tax=Perkinsus olseni TaxID=32597 RepID=A0A7J6PES4_PEROL|nr:hypothetical protein FOZ60_007200 [Perkinsus olseni]